MPTPRLSGSLLRAASLVARTGAGSKLFFRLLDSDLGVSKLLSLPYQVRGDYPLATRPRPSRAPRSFENSDLPLPKAPWSETSGTLVAAYKSGKLSPKEAVERVRKGADFLAQEKLGPLYGAVPEAALAEAEASEKRYRKGETLGPLDGVPVVVKEQIAVRGLPLLGGTNYLDGALRDKDAFCIERLRASGAIIVGQTHMTELGMCPVGQNKQRTMPRNPHDPSHVAGGSSTGTGVAVATGLVPWGVGADGGGSIRIPAAMTGVFGLKPTWGRVSRRGDLLQSTVTHIGPIATSTMDLAHGLEVLSGEDSEEAETHGVAQLPSGSLQRAVGRGVRGLIIGVADEWGDADDSIGKAGEAAVRALEKEGAKLVPIQSRLVRHAAQIGFLTIGVEAYAGLRLVVEAFGKDISPDLRLTLSMLSQTPAELFADAQLLRAGLRRELREIFSKIDLLALPTTASTAVRVTDGEMESGFTDSQAITDCCRFAFLGNLTGLPAASAPIGTDTANLPIGMQLMGDAYDEATVLAATAHLERIGVATVQRPRIYVDS